MWLQKWESRGSKNGMIDIMDVFPLEVLQNDAKSTLASTNEIIDQGYINILQYEKEEPIPKVLAWSVVERAAILRLHKLACNDWLNSSSNIFGPEQTKF